MGSTTSSLEKKKLFVNMNNTNLELLHEFVNEYKLHYHIIEVE